MTATDLDAHRPEPPIGSAPDRPMHRSTRCPECGVLHHQGRWRWGLLYIDAEQETCPACRRIADHNPSGILIVSGPPVAARRDEILWLIHRQEALERQEHPLHRIMDVAEHDGGLSITTTDVHLPRRLGLALEQAFRGALDLRPQEGAHFALVHWHAVD